MADVASNSGLRVTKADCAKPMQTVRVRMNDPDSACLTTPLYGIATKEPSADRTTRTANIAGVRIDATPFDSVVDSIIARATANLEPAYVVTPNTHHVVLFQRDKLFRDIYRRAFLVVPDGVPLLWAAKLLGCPLRGRVNGTDLFEALCAEAARRNLRVFFLGGRPGSANTAAARLTAAHRSLLVCGTYCPPFGFEQDPAESERMVTVVRAARPDLLFVGLGAPKQEYWMSRELERLEVPVILAIGGSFEFTAGVFPRAPRWMQSAGLEWLHRLGVEPRRLWKRYLLSNSRFCVLVAQQYIAQLWSQLTWFARP